jgi:hypothetical protein
MLTLEFFAAQVISTGALNNQLALVSGFTGVFFFFFPLQRLCIFNRQKLLSPFHLERYYYQVRA